MKKLLFILLFIIVGYTNGQITYIDTTSSGNEVRAYVSTKESEGFKPLPVRSLPMGALGTTATTKGMLDTTPSTTSAAVSYSFTTHYLDIINNTDQVLLLCKDTSYGANTIYIPAYGSYRWSVNLTSVNYKSNATATGSIIINAQ